MKDKTNKLTVFQCKEDLILCSQQNRQTATLSYCPFWRRETGVTSSFIQKLKLWVWAAFRDCGQWDFVTSESLGTSNRAWIKQCCIFTIWKIVFGVQDTVSYTCDWIHLLSFAYTAWINHIQCGKALILIPTLSTVGRAIGDLQNKVWLRNRTWRQLSNSPQLHRMVRGQCQTQEGHYSLRTVII